MKKLCSSRGETLSETLVAVLIIALSAAILATMTATAVRLDQKTDAATAAYYEDLTRAEQADGEAAAGTATLDGAIADDQTEFSVAVTGGSDSLISWKGAGS